jgi:hypothetical protein
MKKSTLFTIPAFLFFLMICSSGLWAQRQNLLFESSFEWNDNNYLDGFENFQHCLSCSYALTRTTASARSGAGALRLEVHDDDPLVSGSIRSELTVPAITDSGERWYGLSYYLKDWVVDGSPHSILQWHPNSSNGSAALAMLAHNGVLTIVHGDPFGSWKYVNIGNIVPDVWTDLVLHVKWDSTNNGLIEVWRDGELVYDTSGIRTEWVGGQYIKVGINHYGWTIPVNDVADERILYIDDVRIGNGDATYADVAPGGMYDCDQPTATLTATETCEGAPYYLVLSNAVGTGPFDLWVNDTTYYNVAVGDSIELFSAAEEHIWNSKSSSADYTDSPVELGVKFKTSKTGFVKGIRFYSHASASGTYTGHLWKADGTLLASATFSSISGGTWEQVLFNDPVLIDADSVYIASYHTSAGLYTATSTGLSVSFTNGSLTALSSGGSGGNGVYAYGNSPSFPNSTYQDANYWADVIFVAIADTFQLLGVTDAAGCTRTGDLQVVTVTSEACASMLRTAPLTVQVAEPAGNYKLGQNYPNPYHGSTSIHYTLPERLPVNISLYDMNGRLVKRLVNGYKEAGVHTLTLHAGTLPGGIYYYRMQAGRFTAVKKMIVQ